MKLFRFRKRKKKEEYVDPYGWKTVNAYVVKYKVVNGKLVKVYEGRRKIKVNVLEEKLIDELADEIERLAWSFI